MYIRGVLEVSQRFWEVKSSDASKQRFVSRFITAFPKKWIALCQSPPRTVWVLEIPAPNSSWKNWSDPKTRIFVRNLNRQENKNTHKKFVCVFILVAEEFFLDDTRTNCSRLKKVVLFASVRWLHKQTSGTPQPLWNGPSGIVYIP